MVEKLTLKREQPPEWLSGNIPCNNSHLVTLHGAGGQGVAVPLALLVADSDLARELLAMCEGPDKHISLVGVEEGLILVYVKLLSSGETQMKDNSNDRNVVKKLQKLLSMLGSKIVLDIRSLQAPRRQHESEVEVSKNSGSKDRSGPNIERDTDHTESQETRKGDLESDSDSNNNHDDVLDIDEAKRKREADTSRMLSMLQKEKSRSRNVSRVKRSRVSAGRKARAISESSISGEEEIKDATCSKVKRSGSIKKRSRDPNDDTSFHAKSLKSLKVSINRNDARLSKDGPLASLDAQKDPRVRGSKSVRVTDDGDGVVKLKSGQFYDKVFKEETPEINDVMMIHDRPWKEDNQENQDSDVEFIHSHKCHCGKSFKSKAGLMSHITQAHKDPETVQRHQCKYCELSTTNFGSLQAHVLNKHQDNVFKCDKCLKKFTSEEKWIDHECSRNRKAEDVKCPDCDVVLKRCNLNRHKKESCKGNLSKSKRTLKLCGDALSKALKEKDTLTDEVNVVIQDVQDDIEAESPQEVNITEKTDDNDPTVRDVYFCTNCPKKGLFKEDKEKHEEETGHKLDMVKLPNYLTI